MPDNTELFSSALAQVAGALRLADDPWWIIGSAAVALHGGDSGVIADVDVITSRRDLDDLYQHLPLADTRLPGKPMFVSERFGRWSEPPLDVEFMAGLTLLEDGEWKSILPQTRERIALNDWPVYVPAKEELIAILRRFGRDKDLRRAASLV